MSRMQWRVQHVFRRARVAQRDRLLTAVLIWAALVAALPLWVTPACAEGCGFGVAWLSDGLRRQGPRPSRTLLDARFHRGGEPPDSVAATR